MTKLALVTALVAARNHAALAGSAAPGSAAAAGGRASAAVVSRARARVANHFGSARAGVALVVVSLRRVRTSHVQSCKHDRWKRKI